MSESVALKYAKLGKIIISESKQFGIITVFLTNPPLHAHSKVKLMLMINLPLITIPVKSSINGTTRSKHSDMIIHFVFSNTQLDTIFVIKQYLPFTISQQRLSLRLFVMHTHTQTHRHTCTHTHTHKCINTHSQRKRELKNERKP